MKKQIALVSAFATVPTAILVYLEIVYSLFDKIIPQTAPIIFYTIGFMLPAAIATAYIAAKHHTQNGMAKTIGLLVYGLAVAYISIWIAKILAFLFFVAVFSR